MTKVAFLTTDRFKVAKHDHFTYPWGIYDSQEPTVGKIAVCASESHAYGVAVALNQARDQQIRFNEVNKLVELS